MGAEQKPWKIEIHRVAEKGIKRLPKDFVQPVWEKIKSLAEDPRPDGYTQVRGFRDIYRVRVGGYRIVYSIIEDRLIILVLEVGPRGKSYRGRY